MVQLDGSKVTGISLLTCIKAVATDDTALKMRGEAAKVQENNDKMKIYCEEDIDENEMAVWATIYLFLLIKIQ